MAAINLYLFGLPRIVYQGRAIEVKRRKAVALVAYLALANLPQGRDMLATLLWPELDQEHARAAQYAPCAVLAPPGKLAHY